MPQDDDSSSGPERPDPPRRNPDDPITVTHSPTTLSIGAQRFVHPSLTVPRSIGRVKLGDVIGQGGMGVVVKGWDSVLHRDVAVKFLLNATVDEHDPSLQQFFGGARAEATVRHPHVVTIFEAGQVERVPYVVMEFVDGGALSAVMEQVRPMPLNPAVKVMWDVTDAVEALHERRIIHRDIKPSNVLFDREGHLFVTDFGLAVLCGRTDDAAGIGGTPAYMAPEMFDGRASPQSDVYAMGIMFFELLAGRLPFSGDLRALREQHASSPLPVDRLPESVPASFIDIIERAAHKKEVFRFKSARQMRRALRDAGVSDEMLGEGSSELTGMIVPPAPAPNDEPTGESSAANDPSTYFDRITELATEKRTTPVSQGADRTSEPDEDDASPSASVGHDSGDVGSTLIEIPLKGWLMRRRLFAIVVSILVWAVAVVVLLTNLMWLSQKFEEIGLSAWHVALFWVMVLVVAVVAFLLWQRRRRVRVRSMLLALDTRGMTPVATDVMRYAFRCRHLAVPQCMVKEMVRGGVVGQTVSVRAPSDQDRIEPIGVPFEPVSLDEADPSFVGLFDDVTPGEDARADRAMPATDGLSLRRIRRNIMLKGGWGLVVMFGVFFVVALIGAIRRRTIDFRVILWGVAFGSAFFEPAGWFRGNRQQWLLVPGGIVLRKARLRRGGWNLHLFERTRSVLCVFRYDRRTWRAIVGDERETLTTTATKREIDALLAAWLSPLEPPSPDRLTDLA